MKTSLKYCINYSKRYQNKSVIKVIFEYRWNSTTSPKSNPITSDSSDSLSNFSQIDKNNNSVTITETDSNFFDATSDSSKKNVTLPETIVYVKNIPYSTHWNDLKRFMSSIGDIKFVQILKLSNYKAVGKVSYVNQLHAQEAIQKLNNKIFFGTKINVVKSSNDKMSSSVGNRAYVFNLKYSVTRNQLFEHLSKFSNVVSVQIITDRSGLSRGCAIAEFPTPEDTQMAIISAHDTILSNRKLGIRADKDEVDEKILRLDDDESNNMSKLESSSFEKNKIENNNNNINNNSNSDNPLMDSRIVMVHNIKYDCKIQDLNNFMSKVGNIDYSKIYSTFNGKYYAIVRYVNAIDVEKAITNLNQTEFNGNVISIVKSNELINEIPNGNRAYVNNLSYSATSEELFNHLNNFGVVKEVELIKDSQGNSKGSAIVTFASEKEAKKAIEFAYHTKLRGRKIFIRHDRD